MQRTFRKRFMDGKCTPQELHQKLAWPLSARCMCGAGPVMQAKVFVALSDLPRYSPEVYAVLQRNPGLLVDRIVDFTMGRYLRVSEAYACTQHRADLEKAAARNPSWAVVEFDRGPNPLHRVAS